MNMNTNKALGGLVVAGIAAWISGWASEMLYHPASLEKNAFVIDVAEAAEAPAGDTAAAPSGPEPIADLLASADIAQGEKLSKVCAACHTFDNGGANRVGPNLFGVVGRGKASAAGFTYSDGMKAKGGSWDYDALNEFLWNPKKSVAGTKMAFVGLKKPEDRAALIKWLETKK